MKVIDINEYKEKKAIKIRLIIIFILIIINIILLLFLLYRKNEKFKLWTDEYIFNKNIISEDNPYIEIDSSENLSVYAYEKYITILEKNVLTGYYSNATKAYELDININNPIYAKNNKYLCIAENNGNNIYLINNENIVWQMNLEGNIQSISVNKNGYVAVIEKGTAYKNIIHTINTEGKELFKTYLSSSNAIATDISENNEYLAIAEIDTSGAIIKSNIKIISIEKAKKDPSNSIENNISIDQGNLITNIKYQEKNRLVYMYDKGINMIEEGENKEIVNFDSKIELVNINCKNSIIYTQEVSSGLFNNSTDIIIKNIQNNSEKKYEIDGAIQSLQVFENNIVINMGTESQIITTSGWLRKNYKSSQEISEILLGNSIVGIVYRNKIEIIAL